MKRFVYLCLTAVLAIVTAPKESIAQQYVMIVLDTSTSMAEDHNGISRLEKAKADAIAGMSQSAAYTYGLYKLSGSWPGESGVVVTLGATIKGCSGGTNNGTNCTNDSDCTGSGTCQARTNYQTVVDNINALPLQGNTPLASAICAAIDELDGITALRKTLKVYTDMGENASYDWITECSDEMSSGGAYQNPEDYLHHTKLPFIGNSSTIAYEDTLVFWESEIALRNTWLWDRARSEEATGRAYQNFDSLGSGEGVIRDWAGGVLPGSWQWRTYYKVATNDVPSPDTDGLFVNTVWEETSHNVRMNATTYLNDITTTTSSFVSALAVRETEKVAASSTSSDYVAPAAGSGISSMMALSPIDPILDSERSFMSGMSEVTKGRYIESLTSNGGAPTMGDMDNDGIVGESDMRFVLSWFGRPVDENNQPSIDSDLMDSGFIDNADIEILRNYWNDINKYPPIVGDTDYNWCVDQSDLNKIWQWYSRTPGPGDQAFYHADLNADGVVDGSDIALYYENEGKGCGSNGIPTCNDGIQYGEETDVDCGGPVCNGCDDGEICEIDDDCLSNFCKDGFCEGGAPVSEVDAVINVTNNWGTGYCATINVTNNAGSATTGWSVELAMNGSSIYTTWNGVFSGNMVTNVTWNGVINPGQTINSTGFCANRNGGGIVSVVSASGTF